MTAPAPDPVGPSAGELAGADPVLIDAITQFADPPEPGERYGSAQALVLDQGRAWTPTPLDADLEDYRGEPGHCYLFAARMADAVPGLVYVEGYAIPFPGCTWAVPHAWVGRLSDGAALDPTWSRPGPAYFGVPLTAAYRRAAPRALSGTLSLLVDMLPRSVCADGLPPGAVATGADQAA
ncbi:hypothetical protein [Nocardiopsis synnemataformans]|uniref:hypothetical protein n=1 Tax=Nocardiopsis synnemataformans TaxID=61305 RepID=UPI003EBE6797